jgi:hypothetical protein
MNCILLSALVGGLLIAGIRLRYTYTQHYPPDCRKKYRYKQEKLPTKGNGKVNRIN